MSETCGYGTCNRPGEVKIGTVGPADPGIELKIAEDGEILIRGRFRDERLSQRPREDGRDSRLRRLAAYGRLGAIDEDGHLRIVDRKKEIIINSAGKNMSPANIEAAIKTSSPLIGQAVCIGDARLYNTALIVLDTDFAPRGPPGTASKVSRSRTCRRAEDDRGRAGRNRSGEYSSRPGGADQEVHHHPR